MRNPEKGLIIRRWKPAEAGVLAMVNTFMRHVVGFTNLYSLGIVHHPDVWKLPFFLLEMANQWTRILPSGFNIQVCELPSFKLPSILSFHAAEYIMMYAPPHDVFCVSFRRCFCLWCQIGGLFCDPPKAAVVEIELENRRVCHVYVCVHQMLKLCTCISRLGILCGVTSRSPKFCHVLTTTLPWFQISTLNAACIFLHSFQLYLCQCWGQIFNFAFEIDHFAWTVWHLPPSFEWFAQYLVSFVVLVSPPWLYRCEKRLKKPQVFTKWCEFMTPAAS